LLYLILDYCPNGNLGDLLDRVNNLSEDHARIYAAEIILALEELHKRDIIYRDLKPDNVVIDAEGHARLTDFGLSKEGVSDDHSAMSFCGSTAYLAPEMIKRKGHGKAVDWYLLGVLIYEMVTGIPPYYSNDKKKMMKNIIKQPLKLPSFVSQQARHILLMLLNKDPSKRLGSGTLDAQSIKEHPWFDCIDWEDALSRKLKVPMEFTGQLPDISNSSISSKLLANDDKNSVLDNYNHIQDWSFHHEVLKDHLNSK